MDGVGREPHPRREQVATRGREAAQFNGAHRAVRPIPQGLGLTTSKRYRRYTAALDTISEETVRATGMTNQREWFDNRFRSELSWRDGTVGGVPAWYSQLLTDLVLATGDEAIRYFSARYVPSQGGNPGSVAVVAFTDELVAYANLAGDPNSEATPLEVTITARRALSSFSLESPGFEDGSEATSVADVRITVTYPQFSRTLPLGASDWADRESETVDLISCLRRDVVA